MGVDLSADSQLKNEQGELFSCLLSCGWLWFLRKRPLLIPQVNLNVKESYSNTEQSIILYLYIK